MKIIDRYVFLEVCVSFLFCFAIFLVTGMIAGFLPILQKGMESGLELTIILFQALVNALPGTLVTVAPLSISVGILLGLGRMASDNEVAAFKSSGVSIVRLLPPVMTLGVIGFALSLICTLVLIPKGISEGKRLMQE
ncbi:MAG: LptF/LptG family permease, partial [Deltaproteobacteria bacterium]|nr:LptF/LptG family permease [Deltaproteobacteria bacterium]